MWPFSFGSGTNYCQEMREILKNYMLQYIKDNPSSGDAVIPIFSDAEVMIRRSSEKQLCKMMKKNHVNAECGVLNILQNFAMVNLSPQPALDYLLDDNPVLELYNAINELKLQKGYISQRQYEENKMLGVKLSLQSPFR